MFIRRLSSLGFLALSALLAGGAGCSSSSNANLQDLPEMWQRRIEVAQLGLNSKAWLHVPTGVMPAPWSSSNNKFIVVTLGDRNGSTGPDADRDGISDADELRLGTNPNDVDTDHDGIPDPFELFAYRTSPRHADTDGDGKPDSGEIDLDNDDPMKDSDGDGLSDIAERASWGSDPMKGDADGDGFSDALEVAWGTSAGSADTDTDGDGFPDDVEMAQGSDPNNGAMKPADSDGDGIPDGDDDDTVVASREPGSPQRRLRNLLGRELRTVFLSEAHAASTPSFCGQQASCTANDRLGM